MGFIKQLLQGDFDFNILSKISSNNPPKRILDTYIKPYPVEYHAQTAVDAVLKLRDQVDINKIEKILIETHQPAYDIIGPKDPEKWDPHTKETADHSIMWIVAAALVWGPIKIDHYNDIRNPLVLSLIKKIEVKVDPELDRMYPKAFPNRITIVTKDGRRFVEQVDYAKGHPRNPLTDSELENKFNELTSGILPADQRRRLLDKLWRIEEYTISDVIDETVV